MKRLTSMQTVENQQVERVSNNEQQQHSVSSSSTVEHSTNDNISVSHQRVEGEQTQVSASEEVVITTTREYDTQKPIDAQTGRPPLLRETVQARHKQNGSMATAQQTRQSDVQNNSTTDKSRRDSLNITSESSSKGSEQITDKAVRETTSECTERRGLTGAQNALCWLGGTVLLLLVLYLIYSIIKRKIKIL